MENITQSPFGMLMLPDLPLTTDQERIVQAQIYLNRIHDKLSTDIENLDEDDFRLIQNQLKDAGLLLVTAGYDDIERITRGVEAIEEYFIARNEDANEQQVAWRESKAFNAAFAATETNPATSL